MTLLELMVALAILTLLLALAPIALNNVTPRWALRAAAQQMESLVLWAQNAAATRDREVRLMVDVPEGTAWVRLGEEDLSEQRLPSKVRFVSVEFATGIKVDDDIASILVRPDMTLDPHTVTLEATGGERAVLEFDRLTGVAVYREEYDAAK
jgi:type II secretory pathway pseudopilin PulG